jgi:hypothetical protein
VDGALAAVKYVGCEDGKAPICCEDISVSQSTEDAKKGTDSSIRVPKFFLYNRAVLIFIVDFFFLAAGELPEIFRCRLSEIVCLARPLVYFPPVSSSSSSPRVPPSV